MMNAYLPSVVNVLHFTDVEFLLMSTDVFPLLSRLSDPSQATNKAEWTGGLVALI